MIKAGIIRENEVIEVDNDKLLSYLQELVESSPEYKENFLTFREWIAAEFPIIEFFVRVCGYTIIYNETVYYQSEKDKIGLDKVEYVKFGYKLNKSLKMVLKDGRYIRYINPIQQTIERIGFEHSESPENELSFWYPKTSNIGFRTPKTIITKFSDEEVNLIGRRKLKDLNIQGHLERLKRAANEVEGLDLNGELFVRLGCSSNKFNFETCHIRNIDELSQKLLPMLGDMYFRLEWQKDIELVLREFIRANYQRSTIYNGMPLNTEFRIFYDFDSKRILGIFNYWDRDTMLDNLYKEQDLVTFANTTHEIESDFKRLSPQLEEEAKAKLPSANLKGRWSIDFLWDGKNFILIDMAHAECSYYYEKILSRELI